MLSRGVLIQLADLRLVEAGILRANRLFDGCVYIAGYAVEFSLKARITKVLGWPGYPDQGSEFNSYGKSLKTHDLEMLLRYTKREAAIGALAEWSRVVADWNPEMRYRSPSITQLAADTFLVAVRKVIRTLAR